MKKVIILMACFGLFQTQNMRSSFVARRFAAFAGLSALNLAALGYRFKSVDWVDGAVATTSAALATNYIQYPPETISECQLNMGLQMSAAMLLIGRYWYKIAQRRAVRTPALAVPIIPTPWTENIYG